MEKSAENTKESNRGLQATYCGQGKQEWRLVGRWSRVAKKSAAQGKQGPSMNLKAGKEVTAIGGRWLKK